MHNFAKKPPIAHDADGVIIGTPRKRRTPDYHAAAKAIVDARNARRDRQTAILEALSPALASPDGPPLREQSGLIDISGAREIPELLRIPRLSGRGGPGSALVLVARLYDGMTGGEAHAYCTLFTAFSDRQGFCARTRGTAIHVSDVAPLIAALEAFAAAAKDPTP
jgi:hypothetical protein